MTSTNSPPDTTLVTNGLTTELFEAAGVVVGEQASAQSTPPVGTIQLGKIDVVRADNGLTKYGLNDLESIISAAHFNVCKAAGNALDHALEAGQAILSVIQRKLVRHNEKEDFYERTCGSARTARNYITLAENRELVESNRQRVADLSYRRALVVIREEKGTKGSKSRNKGSNGTRAGTGTTGIGADVGIGVNVGVGAGAGAEANPLPKSLDGWKDDEIKRALSNLEFVRFKQTIPDAYRVSLEKHALAQRDIVDHQIAEDVKSAQMPTKNVVGDLRVVLSRTIREIAAASTAEARTNAAEALVRICVRNHLHPSGLVASHTDYAPPEAARRAAKRKGARDL